MEPVSDSTAKPKFNPLLACMLALLIVLIAGVVDLRKPFSGDQALFVTGARAMLHGQTLYRDFWDLKQPGIYWFYWLAMHIPASAEIAVHSLELAYFVAFAIVIMISLRRYFYHPATAALAAVFCSGVYFAICGSWHLTQVEGLVGFPLYLSAWLLLGKNGSSPISPVRIVVAGIATAAVMLLKLILGILPICFVLLLLGSILYQQKSVIKCGIVILCFAIGSAIVLIPVLAYYDAHNELPLIIKTFIEFPQRITQELPHNKLTVLKAGLVWSAERMGPLMLLALIGLRTRAKDLLGRGLCLWIILGFALIVIQRMGWQYHFLLLLCPIAILAAAGVEVIFKSHRSLIPIPVLVILFYAGMLGVQAKHQLHDPRPEFYGQASTDTAILTAPGAKPSPIYVLGDPTFYYIANRLQAVPINGWSPEWLLPDQWQDLAFTLRTASPPYVYVSAEDDDLLANRGQAFTKVLTDEYEQISSTNRGRWYARKM